MFDYILLQAAILGLIEGLTEFLPVSSTGHLILAAYLIDFRGPPAKVFEVAIQLGAILAICALYGGRLLRVARDLPHRAEARLFVLSILIAFVPAVVFGVIFHDLIKSVLFSPWVVATMLLVGGVIILAVERTVQTTRYHQAEHLPLPLAFKIGLCQVVAMIPGVSRSGATILGAVLLGVDRRAAAEFSFFLAIPTMLGATALDLYKARDLLSSGDVLVIAFGLACSLLAALLVVRALVAYLARHTFEIFGWYRITVGTVMLVVLASYGTVVPEFASRTVQDRSPPTGTVLVEPIGMDRTDDPLLAKQVH